MSALIQFNKKVKAYRRAHPNSSFRSAQKAVAGGKKATTRKKASKRKAAPKKARKVKRTRVGAASKSTVGSVASLTSALKKKLSDQYGNLQTRLFNAKKAASKKKIRKQITSVSSKLRRLA